MRVVAKNTAYLTIAHLVGYVIPLLEIPILARILGPAAYGQLALIQSIALLMSVIVEYGFNLSSAREVARAIDKRDKLGEIFSNVLAAKLLLTACVILFLSIFLWIGPISIHVVKTSHIAWGILYFIAFAFSPFWFFIGREKVGGVILIELFLRSTCLLSLYLMVNGPDDAGLALALMALTSFSNTLITNVLCLKYLPPVRMRLNGAIDTIKIGFNVFVYRSSNTVLVTAAPALIAALADRAAVGIFVPGEKFIRGVVGLSSPVFTALFPHFSRVLSIGDPKSYSAAWFIVTISGALGAACAVVLYLFGPSLIVFVIGEKFIMTADLLRWFVWLIPLRIVNQALGLVVLIPSGRARQTSIAIVFFSLLSLFIGSILLHEHGALGMVWALLLSELGLVTALLFVAMQKNVDVTLHGNEP